MLQCEVTPSKQQRRTQSEKILEIHRCHLYDHHDHLGCDRVFSDTRIVYRDRVTELVPLAILRDLHWRVRRPFHNCGDHRAFRFQGFGQKIYSPHREKIQKTLQ